MSRISERVERAREARDKQAALGDDLDLDGYTDRSRADITYQEDPSTLPAETKREMLETGITLDDLRQRAGTFVQVDNSVVHSSASSEGIEVLDIVTALEKHGWLEDYLWRAVPADADKYTAKVAIEQSHGYFIRALPGSKTQFPVQSCLYLATERLAQNVHNVVIAEEGSELHIITGCLVPQRTASGLHLGVSEFYVKKGARLTFTMVHNWGSETAVRPRSAAIVEEGGTFLSYYICMRPVRTLQMYPSATCAGKGAVAQFNSVLVAGPGSSMDVGARVVLAAEGARAEVVSRALSTGGRIVARGHIVGQVPEVKGHLECRGLILSDSGEILAIPELDGQVAGVDLSHEAAIGKLAEEELEYLMARGLSRGEATSAIIKGFISVDVAGLPPQLAQELQGAVALSDQEGL
jgi:hypothetical protein